MRALLATMLVWVLSTGVAFAEISVEDVLPEDRVVNGKSSDDILGGNSAVRFTFSADSTGTIDIFVVEPNGNRNNRKSLNYTEADVTETISITVEEIEANPLSEFDLDIRLTSEVFADAATDSGGSATDTTDTTDDSSSSESTTEETSLTDFVVDKTRPEPINLAADEVIVSVADGALSVHWDPAEEYSIAGSGAATSVSDNVEYFRVIWSTQPLSDVIQIDGDQTSDTGDFSFGPIASYGGASSADVDADKENYLINGLDNSVTVYVTVQPIDHAGNGAYISISGDNRALSVAETPLNTVLLSEVLGIDDRCFIATAAFGDPRAGWVDTYRFFRDGFLHKLPWGSALVETYYRYSPPLAHALADHDLLRSVVRTLLILGAPVALLLGGGGPLLLLLGLLLPLRKRWLRRRGGVALTLFVVLAAAPVHAIELIKPGLSLVQTAEIQIGQMQPDRIGGPDPQSGLFIGYDDVYGKRGAFPAMLAYQALPFQLFGDWGFRAGIGFGLDRGKSVNTESGTIEKTGETAKFLYAPTTIGLGWRGRWFENQPVLLSGNVGFDFWGYSEKAGTKKTRNFVYGWHATGQLEILMDWMEGAAALNMEQNYGIVDTLLFVGWKYTDLDDFGNLKTADFTHNDWIAGFRFVF